MRSTKTSLILAVVLGVGAGVAPARGAVTGVSASPGSAPVAIARGGSLTLSWSVTTSTAGSVTVSSARGVFRKPDGTALGSVAQTLSRTITGPATVSFTETVYVPADVIQRAHKEGLDQLRYERSFTDGAAASGQVTLYIVTAKAAGFGLTNLALGFDDDNKQLPIVERGGKLKARAEIGYTGAGLLRGRWEIAGPNPDPDKPAWRVLGDVVQTLTGAESLILASPSLPTDSFGPHLVRLHITEPRVGFDPPEIRYVVGEKKR